MLSPHTKLRRIAVEVLAKHPLLVTKHLKKLRQILKTHTLPVQLDTLWLLSRLKRRPKLAQSLWPLLQRSLQTSSLQKLKKTLWVLFKMFPRSHKASLEEAVTFLHHPHQDVRSLAIMLFSRYKPLHPKWIDLVIKALHDKQWRVRRAAVTTLGVWGPLAKKAEKEVQARLNDPAYPVSIVAQFSLLSIRKR